MKTLIENVKKNKQNKHINIIKNSLNVRSAGILSWLWADKPKTQFNQHFKKPNRPKKLALNNNIQQDKGEDSNKPEKI